MPIIRRHLPHITQHAEDYFITYRQKGTWAGEENKAASFGDLCMPEVAALILSDWARRDPEMIALHAVCIMKDHVHVVLSTRPGGYPLGKILASHKRQTAYYINKALQRQGSFWQEESFDRVLRSGKLESAILYTLQNPVKAGYVSDWKEWPFIYLSGDYAWMGDKANAVL